MLSLGLWRTSLAPSFWPRAPKEKLFDGRDVYEWYTGMKGSEPQWDRWRQRSRIREPGRDRLVCERQLQSWAEALSAGDRAHPLACQRDVAVRCPGRGARGRRSNTGFRLIDSATAGGQHVRLGGQHLLLLVRPKWLSPDGRSFTLVFTGGGKGKNNDSLNTVRGTFRLRGEP